MQASFLGDNSDNCIMNGINLNYAQKPEIRCDLGGFS